MECAALYSEWDVLIKVSVPGTRQLEVVFGKLIRHLKIKTTKTLVTVENMRWQRTQEHIKLVEDPYKEEITNFVEQEKVRRILLVPIDESKTTLAKKRLMDRYEEGKDIKHLGSDVRILPEYRWITNQHMRAPVSFALVDDLYIYERVPQKKQAFLIHGEEEIELYQELFLMNWGAGYTLEKIKEILNNWPEEREESDSV